MAKHIVQHVEEKIIRHKLGIELSSKPEVNRTFATKFEFIGAEFDTSDTQNIRPRPTSHVRVALEQDISWIAHNRCTLVSRTKLQTTVGRLTLYSRFLPYGRCFLNSPYAALTGAQHLQCTRDKAMISDEMAADVATLATEWEMEQWSKMQKTSLLKYCGMYCAAFGVNMRTIGLITEGNEHEVQEIRRKEG